MTPLLLALFLAPAAPAAPAAPLLPSYRGSADSGVFRVFQEDQALIETRFSASAEGGMRWSSTIRMAGQAVTTETVLEVDREGRPSRIALSGPHGKGEIVRDGARVSLKGPTSKAPTLVELKPGTQLWDNFNPTLLQPLFRRLVGTTGKTTYPALVLGAPMLLELEVTPAGTLQRSVGGQDLHLHKLTVQMAGVTCHFFVEASGRILSVEVPQQGVTYVRDGFEELRKAAAPTDPHVSQPTFDVEKSTIAAPMRDGVKLATDLYLPKAAMGTRFPLVLVRTPYKKEMSEPQARYFARRGYAVAIQDVRGRFSSPGTFDPFVNEAEDGHDAIEHLAVQPFCDGKVGMIGGSYLGMVQWLAARERPRHLVTIIPQVTPPDLYFNIPYDHGVLFLFGALWWAEIVQSNATGDLSGVAMTKINDRPWKKLLAGAATADLDRRALGKSSPLFQRWLEHPTFDAYWKRGSFLDRLADVRLPVFHQSGWFDGDGIGTKLAYLKMRSHGHGNQKLVLGPWGHQTSASRYLGDRDMGARAIIDLEGEYLRWFDHWLKGKPTGVMTHPLVSIFVIGAGKWLTDAVYPLSASRPTRFYLRSGGRANTSGGDGRLSEKAPPAGEQADRYTYAPDDPTPNTEYSDPHESEGKVGETVATKKEREKKRSEGVLASRRDILVYDTGPLAGPLTVAGPLSAELWVASSAKDTDFFATLETLDDKGEVLPLAIGKIRARYRHSFEHPEPLVAGQIDRVVLDLWQTGIRLEKGHRLRVQIASAAMPLFERNTNTGGDVARQASGPKAENVLYHDAAHPSHLVLPVVPEATLQAAKGDAW